MAAVKAFRMRFRVPDDESILQTNDIKMTGKIITSKFIFDEKEYELKCANVECRHLVELGYLLEMIPKPEFDKLVAKINNETHIFNIYNEAKTIYEKMCSYCRLK